MKRANGSGSIVRLSGNRRKPYAVRISGKDKFGQVSQKTLAYYATAAQAQLALDKYNQDKERGIVAAVDTMDMTVGAIYTAWSERTYSKAGKSSIAVHKAAWKRVGKYAACKMRQVTVDMWQALLDEDEAAGLSQSSINADAAIINALISYAYRRDILTKNIYEYIEIPRVGAKYEKGALTEPQIAALKDKAAAGDIGARCALMLSYTGFRANEFLNLSVDSYHADGDYLQGGLKTRAGKDRLVPIHRVIKPYVEEWISSKRPTYGKFLREVSDTLAGVGAEGGTPHWCRHTFATRLHNAGVDDTTRKWLLGHTTSDITERYTHAGLAILRQAIDRLP